MEVLISNRSGLTLDLDFFRRLAEEVLGLEKVDSEVELSIVLVTEDEIRELNAQYRGIDTPTDVLSFPQSHDDQEGPHLLGDVAISPQVAQEQALKYGHSFEREMTVLLVHGILHLLGFDHENPQDSMRMREREEDIINRFLAENRIQ